MKVPGGSRRTITATRRAGLGLALLAVLALVSACSSGPGGGGASASAPAASSSGSTGGGGGSMVEVKNFSFTPQTLTVPVGTTVTWKFDDTTDHTVTANDNSFTSQPLMGGKTYTHTFTTAGKVDYHCSIHPDMTASIVVT
jgi:plastocyanin